MRLSECKVGKIVWWCGPEYNEFAPEKAIIAYVGKKSAVLSLSRGGEEAIEVKRFDDLYADEEPALTEAARRMNERASKAMAAASRYFAALQELRKAKKGATP